MKQSRKPRGKATYYMIHFLSQWFAPIFLINGDGTNSHLEKDKIRSIPGHLGGSAG